MQKVLVIVIDSSFSMRIKISLVEDYVKKIIRKAKEKRFNKIILYSVTVQDEDVIPIKLQEYSSNEIKVNNVIEHISSFDTSIDIKEKELEIIKREEGSIISKQIAFVLLTDLIINDSDFEIINIEDEEKVEVNLIINNYLYYVCSRILLCMLFLTCIFLGFNFYFNDGDDNSEVNINMTEINNYNNTPSSDTVVIIIKENIVKEDSVKLLLALNFKIDKYDSGEYKVSDKYATQQALIAIENSIRTALVSKQRKIKTFNIGIIGHTDGVMFRNGIIYDGKDIENEAYSVKSENIKGIESIQTKYFNIKKNELYDTNEKLAFLRGYDVKGLLRASYFSEYKEPFIRQFVKENNEIGGEYRAVEISVLIEWE